MEVIKAFCGDAGPLQVPEIGDFTMKTMGIFLQKNWDFTMRPMDK